MARISQNCTILSLPSTKYDTEPRNSCTETSCPVSSSTSRLAASRGCSRGYSLPFGSTQAFSRRRRTTAKRGRTLPRSTMPPAARIGARRFAESVIAKVMPDGRKPGKPGKPALVDKESRLSQSPINDSRNADHDLAEVLVGGHDRKRFDDVGEHEGLVDRQR